MDCSRSFESLILWSLLALYGFASAADDPPNHCLSCHPYALEDFSPLHPFARDACVSCHRGDAMAEVLPQAHAELIPRPGDLKHDRSGCSGCHSRQVQDVLHSLMNTGRGMVRKTRMALGEDREGDLGSLGDSPADSMLRKLCASCHLSHPADREQSDPTLARGGGCSACHINRREEKRHPRLTSRIDDGRCFGCHSRSGRISLNYAGLAEMEIEESPNSTNRLRLTDGRPIRRIANDVHHQAGMSCIDCHTSTGLMGGGDNTGFKHQAVDIQCEDCHLPPVRQAGRTDWPAQYHGLRRHLEPADADRQVPLTRRYGTPLWQVAIRADGSRLLHPKLGGEPLPIPDYRELDHPHEAAHRRLTCSACHSQWAPQCYGCHSEYTPEGSQWDHLRQRETSGRWHETRWDVRAEPPALGVDAHNRIRPVAPGMIMQVEHPAWDAPLFKRLFALSEPHTTGRARSCESCHRRAEALALGSGQLRKVDGEWRFQAATPLLQDGLPADAWTRLDGRHRGQATDGESRPFDALEMRRILDAELRP